MKVGCLGQGVAPALDIDRQIGIVGDRQQLQCGGDSTDRGGIKPAGVPGSCVDPLSDELGSVDVVAGGDDRYGYCSSSWSSMGASSMINNRSSITPPNLRASSNP